MRSLPRAFFFFFNDTATTEIYTLSLHDALPISSDGCAGCRSSPRCRSACWTTAACGLRGAAGALSREVFFRGFGRDRESTRLNSSHSQISDAVFCLKKKKKCVKATTTPFHWTRG